MQHTHTHTNRNNNTKHRQHNNPSQTNHHPPTHRQQSTKGQKQCHTSNQHKLHQKQNQLKNSVHNTQPYIITIQETKLTQKAKIPHYTTLRTDREYKQGGDCCLPTPMTLASGGSPMFPLVVHQPASPSI